MDTTINENTSKNTHSVVFSLLEKDIAAGQVLDIPCGEGAFTKRLIENNYQAFAADYRNSCKVKEAKFVQADMNKELPLEDASLDAAICIDGIEHIERPYDFTAECYRVLRPGGVVIVSTPNISSLRSRWRWLLTGFHNKDKTPLDETNPNPWHHIHMISFHKLRYMLHRSGFRITSVATNRIKTINYLYLPLIPFAYLATSFVFHKEEKDPGQRKRNKEILKQMFSPAVLFGETLIVKAIKT